MNNTSIVEYLRLPEASLLDKLGPLIIIFIILMFILIAVRMNVWQQVFFANRVQKEKTRREHERFTVSFKVVISTMDNRKQFDAEIQDVSAGGMRLKTPLFGIGATLRYKIVSSTPPLKEVEAPTLIVLRMNEDDEPDMAILRAKWIHMTLKQRLLLTEEIIENIKHEMQAA
ncbi:PilZ domain-containing protein [Calditrichota bacterium]